MTTELALFPLNVVLFPGGSLPLRIFELRYRRLLDECGRSRPFGLVRIRYGQEVGDTAFPFDVGCAAWVVQRVALADGSLAVEVVGERRFRIRALRVEEDGLTRAEVEWLPPDPSVAVPPDLRAVADSFSECGECIRDAGILAWRLAEALPMSLEEQQYLLEESDPARRLNCVKDWLVRHPDGMAG